MTMLTLELMIIAWTAGGVLFYPFTERLAMSSNPESFLKTERHKCIFRLVLSFTWPLIAVYAILAIIILIVVLSCFILFCGGFGFQASIYQALSRGIS